MMFVFLCFRRRQNLFRCWCVMEAEYLREIAGKGKTLAPRRLRERPKLGLLLL